MDRRIVRRFASNKLRGFAAVEMQAHVHDLHASMFHLLGLDHEKLMYCFAGRDFRLTDVHGNVVKEIVGRA